ncbi:MAG: tetratricopeptide repeat protein [Hyphomicrobiaceae bacterium]
MELQYAGNLDEAIVLAKRVVELSEKTLPADHPFIKTSRDSLVALYQAKTRVPALDEIATLNRRVAELHRAGKLSEATPLAERSLALTRAQKGEDHADTASRMVWLAFLYKELDRLADAQSLFERALAINERAQPTNNSLIATSAHHLGNLYQSQGRLDEAEALFKRALAVREASPAERLSLASTLSSLAGLYSNQGKLAEAEAFYKRALEIRQGSQSGNHPDVAQALYNLAIFYSDRSRYAEADVLLERALQIIEQALPAGHPNTARVLNGLASSYREQGRFAEAEPLLKRILEINEKAYPAGHSMIAQSHYNLGLIYHAQRRLDEAEPLYRRALEMREKVLWAGHPEIAWSLHNLAGLHYEQGKFADAEQLLQRALQMRRKVLSASDNAIVLNLNNLAAVEYQRQAWEASAQYARDASAIVIERARRGTRPAAIDASESSRAELSNNDTPFRWFRAAAWRLAEQQPGQHEALREEAYTSTQWASQSSAALALAQMTVRLARGEGELPRLVREHQNASAAWQQLDKDLIAKRSAPPHTRNTAAELALAQRITETEQRLAALSDRLAREFPEYAALAAPEPLSVRITQEILREDEVLIQFAAGPGETFIWAVTKTDARWVRSELGTKALTERVAALRCGLDHAVWEASSGVRCARLVGGGYRPEDAAAGKPLPFDLARAHDLYQALFGQFEELIAHKHLLIVPSGPLTALPFQVLVSEKPPTTMAGSGYAAAAWLARRHAITTLPSVASLMGLRQFARASQAKHPFIGFGNPLLTGPTDTDKRAWDRQACAKAAPELLRTARRDAQVPFSRFFRGSLADIDLVRRQAPLPETADELCAVARSIGANEAAVHLGEMASETAVKALSTSGVLGNARIVHFATHGLVASESSMVGAAKGEPALILTPPDRPTEENDGLLTASEVAQLKLDADWVVLSACNTAAGGGGLDSEAFSGLARAFFYAGARALLVSHWAVDSQATVSLVTRAFEEIRADDQVGRAEALRRSMLALISRGNHNAHPATWAPFVVVGEGGGQRREPRITSSIPQLPAAHNSKGTPSAAKKRPTAKKSAAPDWRSEIFRQ